MKLIHSNEFCREIAIWYDEYLTPGEDFTDMIEAALKKSDLFVLAVTPNLVNEINYVMEIEYPMARSQGKPVIPVQMVETNTNHLRQSFKEIPDPVSAGDQSSLADVLLRYVDAIKRDAGAVRHIATSSDSHTCRALTSRRTTSSPYP